MPTEVTKNWSGSSLRKVPGNWEALESFTVTGTDNKSEAISAAVAEYPTHPDNPQLRVGIPQADAIGLNVWRVTLPYSFRGTLGVDDPLSEPTRYFGDFEQMTVQVDRDVSNNPIVNSAGDPPDPPATEGRTVFVLRCERNVPAFSVVTGYTFTNATNSNSFTLPGAGTVGVGNALCRVYRPVGEWSFGDAYVRVQGVFAFLPGESPWEFFMRDQGRNSWYNDGGNKKGTIVKANDDEPIGNVALDGTGKPLLADHYKVRKGAYGAASAAAIANPTLPAALQVVASLSTADSKVLIWYTKQQANFSSLPF